MRIEINLRIILLFILFFVLKELDIYVMFLVFIILHELAHLVVGMICGFKPKVLRINELSVSIEFYIYSHKRSLKKIITYLAGPIFNFVIAIIFMSTSINNVLKMKIIYTNILLGLFNLIPIMPLDGGKILKEILMKFITIRESAVFMNTLTNIVLILLTLSYSIIILKVKNFAIFLLLIYLWYLKYLEDKKLKIFLRVYDAVK